MTEYDLRKDDYPYELPENWEAVDVPGDHVIYENSCEEYAIELMRYEREWWLSTSKPNPMRGGMMDLVDHWEYELDELDKAFNKIREITEGDI